MLEGKVYLTASEFMFTYTFKLQLQMPHVISHCAVIVDQTTADGEMQCVNARVRGCEHSKSHDVERLRSNSCGVWLSGLWSRLFGTKRM